MLLAEPQTPVTGMSLRRDNIDNFWFVLRHEIEHVLRGDGIDDSMIDWDLEGERAGTGDDLLEEERLANRAAPSSAFRATGLGPFWRGNSRFTMSGTSSRSRRC